MAIVRVQSTGLKRTTGTEVASLSMAMPSNVTAGNKLTAWVGYDHSGGGRDWGTGSLTTTGAAVVTWTRVTKNPTDTTRRSAIYIGTVTTGGSCTVVAAPTGGNTTIIGGVVEVSGLRTNAINVYADRDGDHSGITDFASQANCWVIAGWMSSNFVTAQNATDPSNWTAEFNQLVGGGPGGMMFSRISTDIQQHNVLFDLTGGGGNQPSCIAVFEGVDEGTPSENVSVTAPQIMAANTHFDESIPFPSFSWASMPIPVQTLYMNTTTGGSPPNIRDKMTLIETPVAGTFKNLVVHLNGFNAGAAGSISIALRKNRSLTPLSVRFTGTTETKRNTARSVHVAAGDLVSMCAVLEGTTASTTGFRDCWVTMEFEPDTPRENLYGWAMRTDFGGNDQQLPTTGNRWNGVFTGQPDDQATSGTKVMTVVAVPGELKEIRIRQTVAPGAGKSRTYTIYRNGSIEASTAVTIADTATTGSVTLGSPLVLSAGDYLWVEIVPINTPAATDASFAIRYEVDTLGQCQWTNCNPDDTGNTNNRRNRLNGGSVTSEGWQTISSPIISRIYSSVTQPLVLSGMQVRLEAAPGATKSWQFRTEVNEAFPSQNIDFTISDPNQTGNSGSDFVELLDGDFTNIRTAPTNTPTATPVHFAVIVAAPTPDFNEDVDILIEGHGDLYEDEHEIPLEGPAGWSWLEVTDSNDVVHSFGPQVLTDPSTYPGGMKPASLKSCGTIKRSFSGDDGKYEGTDVTPLISDTDHRCRDLMENTFLPNRAGVIRTIKDALRRQFVTPRTIFRGLVRTYKPLPNLDFQFTFQDSFASKFSLQSGANQLPRRKISTVDFPAAPGGPTSTPKTFTTPVVAGPPGYVQLSDQAAARNLIGDISNGVYAPDEPRGWYGYNANGSEKIQGSEWYLLPGDVYWATPDVAEELEKASGGTSELTSIGLAVPVIYGKITDVNVSAGGGKGQMCPVYVGVETINDRDYHVFVVAGHACKKITGVYINDGASGVGTYPASAVGDLATAAGDGADWIVPTYGNWTAVFGGGAPVYEDRNGRRYTIIYGAVGNHYADVAAGFYDTLNDTACRLTVCVEGIEDIGDGTGQLINNIHLQYLHWAQNWAFGDYQSGAWLASPVFPDEPTLSMIDEDSFRKAANIINYTGAWVLGHSPRNENSEFISIRENTAQLNVSGSVNSGWNRKGQFFVDYLNILAPVLSKVTLISDEQDILKGTFTIDEDQAHHYNVFPYRHTRDYCGREKDGWLSIKTGITEIRDEDSITNYSPVGFEITLPSPVQEYHMLRGRNVEADSVDYEDGNDTIEDVLDRFRITHVNPPRIITFKQGETGHNIELGDIVPIKHYGGSGLTGWTNRRARCIKHDSTPSRYDTTLTFQDLERIL